MIPGRGVIGIIDNKDILAGNVDLLSANGIQIDSHLQSITEEYLQQGKTIIYLALERKIMGLLILADAIREESGKTIRKLTDLKLSPVLLTGDNQRTAKTIADSLQIKNVHAECLPEDKLAYITGFKKDNKSVCMIGDGINDAPALATADMGIAMGTAGTHAAVEAADIVIMNDDLSSIPRVIKLSKDTFAILVQNIALALGIKALFIVLAVLGMATMWMAVFADVGTTLLVLFNGLRMLRK